MGSPSPTNCERAEGGCILFGSFGPWRFGPHCSGTCPCHSQPLPPAPAPLGGVQRPLEAGLPIHSVGALMPPNLFPSTSNIYKSPPSRVRGGCRGAPSWAGSLPPAPLHRCTASGTAVLPRYCTPAAPGQKSSAPLGGKGQHGHAVPAGRTHLHGRSPTLQSAGMTSPPLSAMRSPGTSSRTATSRHSPSRRATATGAVSSCRRADGREGRGMRSGWHHSMQAGQGRGLWWPGRQSRVEQSRRLTSTRGRGHVKGAAQLPACTACTAHGSPPAP